jgi:hypothetical protein
MAFNIILKNSSTSGQIPATYTLELGELAINTYDGKVFLKKEVNGVQTVVEVAGDALRSLSIATANGFAGISTGGTNPAITLSTTVSGILKGNGTSLSAATPGVDYLTSTAGTASWALNLVGAGGISSSYAATASYAILSQNASTANISTYAIDAGNAVSSSRAISASYANVAAIALSAPSSVSSSYALNAFNAVTASYILRAVTASFAVLANQATTATRANTAGTATSSLFANTATNATSASFATTATSATSASFASRAATATNTTSASYALNASNATTASFATRANVSDLSVLAERAFASDTATTATTATQAISASMATNALTASRSISASYALNSTNAATASYVLRAVSASHALQSNNTIHADRASTAGTATSSLFATTAESATSASYALNAFNAVTASYVLNAVNSSFATLAQFATESIRATTAGTATSSLFANTATTATSASYALNANNAVTASYVETILTSSFSISSSHADRASRATTASFAFNTINADSALSSLTASFATRAANASNANFASVAGYTDNALSASIAVSAIYSREATFAYNSNSSSYALTASYAVNAANPFPYVGNAIITGSLTVSGALVRFISDNVSFVRPITASLFGTASYATTASYALNAGSGSSPTFPFSGNAVITGSLLISGSGLTVTGSIKVSGSGITGSLFGTSSWAVSSSYALSASYAATASSADVFIVRADTFEFTGSVRITGSTSITGSLNATSITSSFSGSLTGSLFGTASWAVSASWSPGSNQSQTASYVTSSGVDGPFGMNSIRSASYAATASSADSFIIRADTFEFTGSVRVSGSVTGSSFTGSFTGSLLGTSSWAVSASRAITASYSLNAGSGFPFSGSAVITGSLLVSQSGITVIGPSRFNGDQIITGSVIMSGSVNPELIVIGDQIITGSLRVTGSTALTGSLSILGAVSASSFTGSFTGSLSGSLFGTASWAQSASFIASTGNAFIQGGNSFGVTAILGTNDSQSLQFETSGSIRMTISGSNGNVGIGTTLPLHKLHIQGTSITSTTVTNINQFSGIRLDGNTSATERLGIAYQAGGGGGASILLGRGGGFDTDISFYTNPGTTAVAGAMTERMTINSIGNIGIGISPATRLHISGANGEILRLQASGIGDNYIAFNSGSTRLGYIGYGSAGNNSLALINGQNQSTYIGANNAIVMTITGSNVGIGTITPGAELEVNGRIRIVTGSNEIYSSGNRIVFRAESTDNAAQIAGYGIFLPRTAQPYNLYLAGSANLGYSDTNATLDITSGSSGALTVVRLNVNGNSFLNGGNLGIGTTIPTAKLTISGSGVSMLRVESESSADTLPTVYIEGNKANSAPLMATLVELRSNAEFRGKGIHMTTAGSNTRWFAGVPYNGGASGYQIGYDGSANGQAYTPASASLFIDTSRNVGIGIATPSYKLTVATSTFPAVGIFRDVDVVSVGPAGQSVEIGARSGSNFISAASIIGGLDNPGLTGNLTFQTRTANTLTTKMFISASGNVGIATVTPYEKLEVAGAISATGTSTNNGTQGHATTLSVNSGTSYLQAVDWGAEFKPLIIDGKTINLQTGVGSTTSRITIDVTGSVGIGVTAPTSRLDVNGIIVAGNTTTTNGSVILQDQYSLGHLTNFGTNASSGGPVVGYCVYPSSSIANTFVSSVTNALNISRAAFSVDSEFRWYTGGSQALNIGAQATLTQKMALTNTGNLGIGISSPAYRLDVSGSARITGSLAVGNILPSATVGRIDATNDVVAFSTSDIRFKTNITPISGALDKITQISGYEFDWIPNQEYHGFEGHDVGIIAQEIEKVLPEVVKERDSGYKAVKYEKIVPLLIEAIKEQQQQIDELKYYIIQLQNKT